MAKQLSITTKIVKFYCTSCQKEYLLVSGHKEDVVNIDICSNCHPFYLGKQAGEINLGPAEKLKDKFARGKEIANMKKPTTNTIVSDKSTKTTSAKK